MGGLPTSTVNGFAVHPSNPKIMWVAMRDGIFRTDNAGDTWTRAERSPKNAAAVAVNASQPRELAAATSEGRIFVSDDGGLTWKPVRAAAGGPAVRTAALTTATSADAQDPFGAMAALRVAPPTPAPDVLFRTLDGREVRLRELRGKSVLLGFFTTW